MKDHERFEQFLAKIDLKKYREQYSKIKIVELDLDKSIQPLGCIYQQYWDKRNEWIDYDDFYDLFKNSINIELEKFREDKMFSRETFYRGFPARIYRTWTSLLTQIQGAYVAEEIYGKKNVTMSVADDYRGKDLKFNISGIGWIPVQIKKISQRREAQGKRKGNIIEILYDVPSSPPFTAKKGNPSVGYKRWEKKWGDKLSRLDNGFIIFKQKIFEGAELLRGRSCLKVLGLKKMSAIEN